MIQKNWQGHEGTVVASANGFDVIDCKLCGFKHIIPIPTEEELEKAYQHDYYIQEKPLYIERYREDLDWWNMVYAQRYAILEQHLPAERRRLLDIGSGPGFFLLNGKKRGWQVKGIEPSMQAAKHSLGLGLDIENVFFTETTAPKFGHFDAINMGEVLEHIPDPAALLSLVNGQLNDNGMVCIIVPNDFNPFQMVLRDHLGFEPWWVAPPHHINYFDFDSLSRLVERCGFEVVHKEATFPIDMFLLMGDNYIGNDELGRACHTKRMNFEKAMNQSGLGNVLTDLYSAFASQGMGREVVLYMKKNSEFIE
ncbi:MAG: class I SAM-dependent methyltransferase [Burkholderiales bacterium]|nr:class I SAM-dependent methyltransferase [Burkholderiales bacterium]